MENLAQSMFWNWLRGGRGAGNTPGVKGVAPKNEAEHGEPNAPRYRKSRGGDRAPRIRKSTVEARQGRRGSHVLIILVVSLALIAIAYFVLYFLIPRPGHQVLVAPGWPILAATTPVTPPTMAPLMMSLSQ